MTDKQSNEEYGQLYEFEIIKQRYESLEKTLVNIEKEKEYYQVCLFIYLKKFHYYLYFSKFMNEQKKNMNILKKNI